MNIRVEQNINHRKFYQILMTMTFAIKTGYQYYYLLRLMIYVFIFYWFFVIVLAPGYIILEERYMDMAFRLELIQYMMVGILNSLVFVVFKLKGRAILCNYNSIQRDFTYWSKKNGKDPDEIYRKNVQTAKYFVIIFIVCTNSITFGPLTSAIIDIDKSALDSRSHFILFLPKIIEINNFGIYGIMYLFQIMCCIILYTSIASFNFGFFIFLKELSNQFHILLDGLKDSFNSRMLDEFRNRFVDCIRHHQMIIKFLVDLNSYFKWIYLIEMILMQGITALHIFSLTRFEASLGYKIKIIGSLLFNSLPFFFHCHIGEVVQNLHNRLAEHIYGMTWYDMPNKHKQLIIIMYQRTQKDLTLNSALFSSTVASRAIISKIIKQIYTIANVLIKT